MKCYKCGQDMSEDDNFCGVCGAENILKKYNEIKNSKNNEENIDQNNIQTDNGKNEFIENNQKNADYNFEDNSSKNIGFNTGDVKEKMQEATDKASKKWMIY